MPKITKLLINQKTKGLPDSFLKREIDRLTRRADFLRGEGFTHSADRIEVQIATMKNKVNRRLIDGDKHPG